ncbi:hypothetical protein CONLIGDRAFT_147743 [Coniochaeta ligniaria NRRL 30616]|uniref:Uncharacterized protein n=1 Tax=Coniochaeta ligniaria NRRL 30616 TaxID=1408157 RepID=A0A1J7IYQ7_9PEZI|nr:hypothetical protein CONLIGDRAFT_147743 [Coniochaeta ligniaria NRRL 30616]
MLLYKDITLPLLSSISNPTAPAGSLLPLSRRRADYLLPPITPAVAPYGPTKPAMAGMSAALPYRQACMYPNESTLARNRGA